MFDCEKYIWSILQWKKIIILYVAYRREHRFIKSASIKVFWKIFICTLFIIWSWKSWRNNYKLKPFALFPNKCDFFSILANGMDPLKFDDRGFAVITNIPLKWSDLGSMWFVFNWPKYELAIVQNENKLLIYFPRMYNVQCTNNRMAIKWRKISSQMKNSIIIKIRFSKRQDYLNSTTLNNF